MQSQNKIDPMDMQTDFLNKPLFHLANETDEKLYSLQDLFTIFGDSKLQSQQMLLRVEEMVTEKELIDCEKTKNYKFYALYFKAQSIGEQLIGASILEIP